MTGENIAETITGRDAYCIAVPAHGRTSAAITGVPSP